MPPALRIAASSVSCGLKPESTSASLGGDPVLKSMTASVPSRKRSIRSGRAVRRKVSPSASESSSEELVSTAISFDIGAARALEFREPMGHPLKAGPDEARDLRVVHIGREELTPDGDERLARMRRKRARILLHESREGLVPDHALATRIEGKSRGLELIETKHVTGENRIRVAQQGLDRGDAQLSRLVRRRNQGCGTRHGRGHARRVEAIGEPEIMPTASLRLLPAPRPGDGLEPLQEPRGDGVRALRLERARDEAARSAASGDEIMRRLPDAPLGRG